MAERRKSKPRNNVYTVLVAVAFLALVFGIVFVWLQTTALSGETNPFESLGALPNALPGVAHVSGA